MICARTDFAEIMEVLDKRLNDKGKNWRHVYKVRSSSRHRLDGMAARGVKWCEPVFLSLEKALLLPCITVVRL